MSYILLFTAGFIAGFFIAVTLLLISLRPEAKSRPLTKDEWKSGMRERNY